MTSARSLVQQQVVAVLIVITIRTAFRILKNVSPPDLCATTDGNHKRKIQLIKYSTGIDTISQVTAECATLQRITELNRVASCDKTSLSVRLFLHEGESKSDNFRDIALIY